MSENMIHVSGFGTFSVFSIPKWTIQATQQHGLTFHLRYSIIMNRIDSCDDNWLDIEDEISDHAMIDHSMQVSLCAGPLVGSNMDLPEQPPSNSQPADPGLSDSQPADQRLSDSQPADQHLSDSRPNLGQPADSLMEDVLLIPQRKLYSVSLSMFFVILRHGWVWTLLDHSMRVFRFWNSINP